MDNKKERSKNTIKVDEEYMGQQRKDVHKGVIKFAEATVHLLCLETAKLFI